MTARQSGLTVAPRTARVRIFSLVRSFPLPDPVSFPPLPLPPKVLLAAAPLILLPALALPALAQQESWRLQRGSKVGPETRIEPVDCVTDANKVTTCGTKVVNPKGITPAKPSYQPFSN